MNSNTCSMVPRCYAYKIIYQITTLEILEMWLYFIHCGTLLNHAWPLISKSKWVRVVNYVQTHTYRGLGCRYCLLNNELHKCNAFLSRHYWFAVSLKSIHNSYLSCRLFLDSWENPFKAWAGRRQETHEAVSENWSDRKWKGERSSQSPNIPTKSVPGGCKVKGERLWWAQLCAMRSVQSCPSVTPKVTTSTGSYT